GDGRVDDGRGAAGGDGAVERDVEIGDAVEIVVDRVVRHDHVGRDGARVPAREEDEDAAAAAVAGVVIGVAGDGAIGDGAEVDLDGIARAAQPRAGTGDGGIRD